MPGPPSRGSAQQDGLQRDAAVGHPLGVAECEGEDQLLEQGPDLGLHITLRVELVGVRWPDGCEMTAMRDVQGVRLLSRHCKIHMVA